MKPTDDNRRYRSYVRKRTAPRVSGPPGLPIRYSCMSFEVSDLQWIEPKADMPWARGALVSTDTYNQSQKSELCRYVDIVHGDASFSCTALPTTRPEITKEPPPSVRIRAGDSVLDLVSEPEKNSDSAL